MFRTGNAYERPIQRVLIEIFDRERDNAFTTEDLCERIWPDFCPDQIKRSTAHGTVIRAVRHIASQRPAIQWLYSRDSAGCSCSSGTTR